MISDPLGQGNGLPSNDDPDYDISSLGKEMISSPSSSESPNSSTQKNVTSPEVSSSVSPETESSESPESSTQSVDKISQTSTPVTTGKRNLPKYNI